MLKNELKKKRLVLQAPKGLNKFSKGCSPLYIDDFLKPQRGEIVYRKTQ